MNALEQFMKDHAGENYELRFPGGILISMEDMYPCAWCQEWVGEYHGYWVVRDFCPLCPDCYAKWKAKHPLRNFWKYKIKNPWQRFCLLKVKSPLRRFLWRIKCKRAGQD